jgi:hypothetical protein
MSAVSLIIIITVGLARSTWTQGVKVVIRIDPSTVSIVPMKFYRVVSYGLNVDQLRIWHRDKFPVCAMALAHGAGTIPTQVRLWIVPHMAIIPNNSNVAL